MQTLPSELAASNVRAEFARRRLNSSDLSEWLGISRTAAAERLTGKRALSINELATIAIGLDVPLIALIDGGSE